jgi:hypothetical protein
MKNWKIHIYIDTPRLTQYLHSGKFSQNQILRKSELNIRMINCIRTRKGVNLNPKLQYTEICSAAA